MALFTPSESPAIVTREIDLTGGVPNVQTSTGAIVGNFRWGPVEQATLIDNEASLVRTFSAPDDSNAIDFLSAAYFLRYSNALQVVRMVDSDANNAFDATNSDDSAGTASSVLAKNIDHWNTVSTGFDTNNHTFIARFPGTLGNSIKIEVCPYSTSDSAYDNWAYATSFDEAPDTSVFASAKGNSSARDEVHVAVIDEDGLFTGVRNTVLEKFPYVSLGSNAKNTDGTTNYVKDIINNRSQYIWMAGFGTSVFDADAGTEIGASNVYGDGTGDVISISLSEGGNSSALGADEYANGFDLFEDTDTVTVDFLIAPGMASRGDQTTVVNDLVSIAQSTRKDCVAVTSPARSDIVNATDPNGNAVTTAATFTSSSYLIVDNNYLKVYDKYNDKYVYIPAASSTAGIMAATDLVAAPWFSPAGPRRGQYLGITALSYSPTKSQRDVLYRNGVNPIANIPGQGVLLFGDKTKLARPSAFDRINVRRLFLAVERAIAIAARNTLFEFNDEFTRAEFVNIVEPFLREIKGRRGITDFRVICDETNNTAAVIDRNEFIANIFIKPARSINYITLNFVAVRTGVDFEEVAGTV
jgi:hypothetical protein